VVESVGLGEGVVDDLMLHGINVIAYRPGAASEKPDSFLNLKAQVWFDVAKWFSLGVYDDKKMGLLTFPVPQDPALAEVHRSICEQLEWPWYEFRGQKTIIAPKEDTKAQHNGVSPDYADAYVQGIWHLPMVESTVIGARKAARERMEREGRSVLHPMAY
jgi:hypothetical protein